MAQQNRQFENSEQLYKSTSAKNAQVQTAVEWLIKELEDQKLIKIDKLSTILFNKNFATTYELIIEQAKAMEKDQMHKCASFWRGKENEIEKNMFEIWYNKTYKK